MATRRSNPSSARTGAKSAGKPVVNSPARARTANNVPSHEDLDLRDRLKSGPRRQAGPPLTGDVMTRTAMDALRNEVVPEPTDPKNRRARK